MKWQYSPAAVSASLHCLAGCSIGEISGLVIGTIFALSNGVTIIMSIALAFVFGYSLSLLPVVKAGVTLRQALLLVLAADSLSIASMELADNLIMALVPGAMSADLVNPLFWATMPVALLAGFLVAVPVNQFLLGRGKGHALVHTYHHKGHKHA